MKRRFEIGRGVRDKDSQLSLLNKPHTITDECCFQLFDRGPGGESNEVEDRGGVDVGTG
jgi:hypothetical protein